MITSARRERRILVETPGAEREWTLTEDLAGAFATVLRARELPAGVLHLAAPETLSDEQLARRVAGALEPEVGSVEVVLSDAAGPSVRPPLRSRHAGVLGLPTWTSFEDGLKQTLEFAPAAASA
jgi:nucleoside-diphosphate-sugar epimerase